MPLPNREQLTAAAEKLLRRVGRRAGWQSVRADYYSPLVDLAVLPASIFSLPAPMPGLELDLDRQLAFVRRELMPYVAELNVPVRAPDGPFRLFLDNPWYGPLDAELLYAMVRWSAPERVLELGSGFSTLFIERALEDAGRPGAPAAHVVVDPYPSPLLAHAPRELDVRPISGAELPAAQFGELVAGDILFVDTSHVVRPGGEVVRLVLELLATLRPGVLVQFHDIFRPFEYPRIFYERFDVHWQEQYLLQAFLAFNPNFEVLCANHALWRQRRDEAAELFPGLREGMQPGGFWFRRRATSES